jgi:hypothetical protein
MCGVGFNVGGVPMVAVSVDNIRYFASLQGVSKPDDTALAAFYTDIAAFVGDDIGKTIDPTNCTQSECNVIEKLTAATAIGSLPQGNSAEFQQQATRLRNEAMDELKRIPHEVSNRFIIWGVNS